MPTQDVTRIQVENTAIRSRFLDRIVLIDFYYQDDPNSSVKPALLLINDGQDLTKFSFSTLLQRMYEHGETIFPLLCVGIHCGTDRKMEYGVAGTTDYKGRGARAGLYTSFVLEELMPFIQLRYPFSFREKGIAGFSLGGLMALDIAWNHPVVFTYVGVFSASLWWRNIDQDALEYDDDKHRIMHQRIRESGYKQGLKFFFQCGNKDETKDRNRNGIIDSIEDTRDMVKELFDKGYHPEKDIRYLEMPDGHHDVFTWGRAMPEFFKWALSRDLS